MGKFNPLRAYNNWIKKLEEIGFIDTTPGILRNYDDKYPFFKELEANYDVIRKECEALLNYKDELHDVQGMGGNRTVGGIHDIQWKSFMFKTGSFIEENCSLCPETAKILKRTPRIKQAFFSILYPNQYITPHRGYFKGFQRYHLGVIVPNNNEQKKCWLRVDDTANLGTKEYTRESMDSADTYYWKNGEGIIFDDNYLHDAANESDEIRVVLWIDVVRKFPFWFDWLNRAALLIAYQNKRIKRISKKSVVKLTNE